MGGTCYQGWVAAILLSMVFVRPCCAASAPGRRNNEQAANRERKLWKTLENQSKFVALSDSLPAPACESTTPPEPLTTPDPLIDATDAIKKVSVSFVIGADGLVHSALLLRSLGDSDDWEVLNVVRSWRYRPAMCNGVPTESEATVDFSTREGSFGLK